MSYEENIMPKEPDMERIEVYNDDDDALEPADIAFREETGNSNFTWSRMTLVTMLMLMIVYPVLTLGFGEDPTEMLNQLNDGMRMVLLISTIIFQWALFTVIYIAVWREKTDLLGIGFKRIRFVDFAYGGAFLLGANLILTGLAYLLAQIGLPMPGEISMLIPTDPVGRVVWVGVSITAGVCEESMFRGYLMTRLRLLGRFQNWVIPTIVSAVLFGACHSYQGWPGFIMLTVYGVFFSLLYIRTRSIWPGVIAHFLQDVGALFWPH
jgi:membrane protease YdiL (CAAX protease family)